MSHHLLDSLIRLRALLGKEFLQLLRSLEMRFLIIAVPLIQLLVFGYAARFDVHHAEIGVVDQAMTQTTRELLAAVSASAHFSLYPYPAMTAAATALDRRQIRAIVQFPADFERTPVVQLVTQGADPNSAQMIAGELTQALLERAQTLGDTSSRLRLEERAWFNENLDDLPFFVPGIIATVVLITTLVLTAMTVVRERELGTLERLLVTPITRLELLLGKLIAVAIVGLVDVLMVTAIAIVWFEVPLRGSFAGLLLGSLLFLLSTLGIGLLISSYSKTQQQAMLLAFLTAMLIMTLSGFAFPINNMPESIQWLSWLDPLRYYLVLIRDLFLKGSGLGEHGFEYGMMGLLGMVTLLPSLLRMRA
jgi:ABC-2 type transport system permease protein